MLRKSLFSIFATLGLSVCGFASQAPKASVGIVNFSNCMTESKLGKQEQASFDSLKTQMTSLIQDTEKQLNEIAGKFNDNEYMDGLSPEAEEEMKNRFGALNEEISRYQNQYYQVMNQAQMKLMQTLGAQVQVAAEKVAQNKKLSMVLNKEACFFTNAALDVTGFVIAEMDREFDQANAKVADASSPQATNAQK